MNLRNNILNTEIEKSRIDRVNGLHTEVLFSAKVTVDKAVEAGEILTEIKQGVTHGEWLPWIRDNLLFSQQTVNNYMRVYIHRGKLLIVGNLSEAYKTIEDLRKREERKREEERAAERYRARAKRREPIEREPIEREPRDLSIEFKHPSIPTLAKEENEPVDSYLKRREKIHTDNLADAAKHNAKVEKNRTQKIVEEMEKWYPENKVTEKGVHYNCGICGKKSVKKYLSNNADIKTLLCDNCKSEQILKEEYPDNKIKGSKVQFICEHCGKAYWWSMYGSLNQRFCSKYCKYCSTLKNPPKWNKEEWEKVKQWEDQRTGRSSNSWWDRVFEESRKEEYEFSLGNPSEDKKQTALFEALEDYFDCFEDPNHRLSAIQNVVKNLKTIGCECHVQINDYEEEPTEIKLISYSEEELI